MSSSDSVVVLIAKESTPGTFETSNTPITIAPTSVTPSQEPSNVQSNRITGASGCPNPEVRTSLEGRLSIGFELMYDELDWLLPGALHSDDWDTESGSAIAITDGTLQWSAADTLTGAGDFTTSFAVGDHVYIGDFADDLGVGWRRITGVTSTTITVETFNGLLDHGSPPETTAGPGPQLILTGRAYNQTTFETYSIEVQYTDLATDGYHGYAGMAINSLNLSMSSGAIITGTIEFIGVGLDSSRIVNSSAMAAPTAAVTGRNPMNGQDHFALFNEAQKTVATPICVKSFDLTLNRNVTMEPCMGRDVTTLPSAGQFQVNGNLSAEFGVEDVHILEDFLDGTPSSIFFALPGPTGGTNPGSYAIDLKNLNWTGASAPVPGPSQKVNLESSFSVSCDSNQQAVMVSKYDNVTDPVYQADLALT